MKFPKPRKTAKVRKPIVRNTRLSAKNGQRPKPATRRPKSPYRRMVIAANEVWRHLIYAKEPSGVCPVCLKREWVHAMHCFIKGRYHHVRFELDNGAPGCHACHRHIDNDHSAKLEFFTRYLGTERYERLRLRAISRSKMDLPLTLMFLRAEAKKLGLEVAA